MAVALLALVMAMTGGAFAATSATTAAKKKPKTVSLASQIRSYFNAHKSQLTGAPGPVGAGGPQGPTGLPGHAGPVGAAGATNITVWNATAAVGAGGSSGTGVVTLAQIGPFTLVGKCTSSAGRTYAWSYIRTSQLHSAIDDYEYAGEITDFNPTSAAIRATQPGGQAVPGDQAVGSFAGDASTGAGGGGTQGAPRFDGPNDGSTSAISADLATYIDAFTTEGVWVGTTGGANPSNPACEFSGFAMSNVAS